MLVATRAGVRRRAVGEQGAAGQCAVGVDAGKLDALVRGGGHGGVRVAVRRERDDAMGSAELVKVARPVGRRARRREGAVSDANQLDAVAAAGRHDGVRVAARLERVDGLGGVERIVRVAVADRVFGVQRGQRGAHHVDALCPEQAVLSRVGQTQRRVAPVGDVRYPVPAAKHQRARVSIVQAGGCHVALHHCVRKP